MSNHPVHNSQPDTRADVVRWIEQDRAVAVVRTDAPESLVRIADALVAWLDGRVL